MASDHPTYFLNAESERKIEEFVRSFLRDGFAFFADEFARIDSYIERARCEGTSERLRFTPKEKYLLELVSYKIMDDLNREEFNRRRNTLIVMPDCISLHNPDCEKIERKHGYYCKRCDPTCQAFAIGDLGRKYGVKTLFSKRALTKQLEHHQEKTGDLAVVGVACVMMLASGMRSAADAGVPARGVLLSFSGCEHWKNSPAASQFAMESLEAILKEKYGTRD